MPLVMVALVCNHQFLAYPIITLAVVAVDRPTEVLKVAMVARAVVVVVLEVQ